MRMQVGIALLLAAGALAMPAHAGPERDGGRPDRPRHDRPGHDRPRDDRPGVIVEPSIILERGRDRGSEAETPAFIMAELARCNAAGIRLFVDCLRHNHGAVMIRRLEACAGSEAIPDDLPRIEPCLPLPPPR